MEAMPNFMNANGSPLGFFTNILGISGRLQGLLLNAVINTIDRTQTEHAIKEMHAEIARSAKSSKVGDATDKEDRK
jgi:hypothetical protein